MKKTNKFCERGLAKEFLRRSLPARWHELSVSSRFNPSSLARALSSPTRPRALSSPPIWVSSKAFQSISTFSSSSISASQRVSPSIDLSDSLISSYLGFKHSHLSQSLSRRPTISDPLDDPLSSLSESLHCEDGGFCDGDRLNADVGFIFSSLYVMIRLNG
ncbi:uncharacterized protein LOC108828304 [Raphanus sativus]|uniref:Uncharacterized protein LOC108828304 n=1 Tax=Raphanus sativus TaxID=3726 RepID=A0A6J0LB95_RAPSA|nr:uncharacterized protein LOC108828304 [Raphanus sativus]